MGPHQKEGNCLQVQHRTTCVFWGLCSVGTLPRIRWPGFVFAITFSRIGLVTFWLFFPWTVALSVGNAIAKHVYKCSNITCLFNNSSLHWNPVHGQILMSPDGLKYEGQTRSRCQSPSIVPQQIRCSDSETKLCSSCLNWSWTFPLWLSPGSQSYYLLEHCYRLALHCLPVTSSPLRMLSFSLHLFSKLWERTSKQLHAMFVPALPILTCMICFCRMLEFAVFMAFFPTCAKPVHLATFLKNVWMATSV